MIVLIHTRKSWANFINQKVFELVDGYTHGNNWKLQKSLLLDVLAIKKGDIFHSFLLNHLYCPYFFSVTKQGLLTGKSERLKFNKDKIYWLIEFCTIFYALNLNLNFYLATDLSLDTTTPTGIYLFKILIETFKKRCEICSKLTIKTPERRHVNDVVLVSLVLTLTGKCSLRQYCKR